MTNEYATNISPIVIRHSDRRKSLEKRESYFKDMFDSNLKH